MSELRSPRLTCREVVELLSDYLDDALAPAERARVQEHLATCPECTAYLEQLRTTIGMLGRLREEDVPPRILSAFVAAFRRWRARGP